MATNMPGGLDTFIDPASTDFQPGHAAKHTQTQDALAAVEKIVVGQTKVNVYGYGADLSGASSSAAAIAAAQADCGSGSLLSFPPGIYATPTTIDFRSNQHPRGAWGGEVGLTPSGFNGSTLKWTGPPNGVIARIMDGQFIHGDGIGLHGNGIAGVTGLLVDSTNSPRTDDVDWDHFYVTGCKTAIQIGSSVSAVPNRQMDKVQLGMGWLEANLTGLLVQSDNAADGGLVRGPLTIDNYEIGVQVDAIGNAVFDGVVFGGYYQGGTRGFGIRTVNDMTTVAGGGGAGRVIHSASGAFTPADVGAALASTGGNLAQVTFVVSYTDAQNVVANRPALGAGTGQNLSINRQGWDFYFTNRWNTIGIRNCQCESATGLFVYVPVTAGPLNGPPPFTLLNNTVGKGSVYGQTSRVFSAGNNYGLDQVAWNNGISVTSFDTWNPNITPGSQWVKPSASTTTTIFAPVGGADYTAQGPIHLAPGAMEAALKINAGGMGFFGHAEAAQPATPVTLADVIAGLRSLGLFA